MSTQNARTVSEFTRKAAVYATAPELNDEQALELLSMTANANSRDEVLDVACGPGVVSCDLARRTHSVVGIDLTAAMLEQAKLRQAETGVQNIEWVEGDVAHLPFDDDAFSLVVSRYAIHHVSDPERVLGEMGRVCHRSGRVAIADIALTDDPGLAKIFNAAERRRDPSHVRAFTVSEHLDLFRRTGWKVRERAAYSVDWELERLLDGTGQSEQDKAAMRGLYEARPNRSQRERLVRTRAGVSFLSYPISIFVLNR